VPKTKYIAKSRASLEALKSAHLLKSLSVSVLITGDKGVGKNSLARYIDKDALTVDGSAWDELIKSIKPNSRLIIKNFDHIKNFDTIKEILDKNSSKIIATSRAKLSSKIEDKFFSLKIYIPPLKERSEDLDALCSMFAQEVKEIFGDPSSKLDLSMGELDLSENCHSLRKSIYKKYIKNTLGEDDLLEMMEDILYKKIGTGNDYREFLYLYDIPLINSGFKKFGSQLSASKAFGLNRNTLRKKINEYNLQEEKI